MHYEYTGYKLRQFLNQIPTFDMRTYKPLIKGTLEKIGSNDSRLKLKYENIDDLEIAVKITTHNEGLEYIFNFLVNSKYKIIDSLSEIDAIGHRIVHGGEKFKESVLITDAVIDEITACIPIAPLHNTANLYGIKTCLTLMPTTPQIAVFDTSFHQTIPKRLFSMVFRTSYIKNTASAAMSFTVYPTNMLRKLAHKNA